ncbi:MAG: hypothetical protein ACYC1K_02505 [Minisyncoccota bacterium]
MGDPQQATQERTTHAFGTEIGLLMNDLEELNNENMGLIQMLRTGPLTPEQWAKWLKNHDAIEDLMARIDALTPLQ